MFPLNDPVLYQVLPQTRKVVINKCYGGFSISKEALEWMAHYGDADAGKALAQLKEYTDRYGGETLGTDSGGRSIPRDNPTLVLAVETLGDKVNSRSAELKVVEIPSDVEWTIEEYDGVEWIAEVHRTWG